jgi:hypothetical protein
LISYTPDEELSVVAVVEEFGALQESATNSKSSGSRNSVLAYLDIDRIEGSRRAAEEQRCGCSKQKRGIFSHGAGLSDELEGARAQQNERREDD